MRKRFVIMLQDSSKESNDMFLEIIKKWSIRWWHYLPDVWLLVDKTGKLSASEIRDELNSIYDCHKLVIELRDDGTDTWAGYGPSSEKRSMFRWIRETWSKH